MGNDSTGVYISIHNTIYRRDSIYTLLRNLKDDPKMEHNAIWDLDTEDYYFVIYNGTSYHDLRVNVQSKKELWLLNMEINSLTITKDFKGGCKERQLSDLINDIIEYLKNCIIAWRYFN